MRAAALVLLLALAGCYGWPRSDAPTVVYNETGSATVVHVVLFDEEGDVVHEDTIEAGPNSRTEGKKIRLSGMYTVEATAGARSARDTIQLGGSSSGLNVFVRDDSLQVGVGTP